jgi:uncharacterized membrane protein YqjE
MAELERRASAAAPARAQESAEMSQLPSMMSKIGDDVMQLVDAKLGLLKIELKEEASFYGRTSALIAVGGVVAALGLALVNVAVALFVSRLFFWSFTPPISYGLGFVVTGAVYVIVGAAIALTMKNRMGSYSPAPQRSIEELRKDKQWLKNEI